MAISVPECPVIIYDLLGVIKKWADGAKRVTGWRSSERCSLAGCCSLLRAFEKGLRGFLGQSQMRQYPF
jgi:hypothetical protein